MTPKKKEPGFDAMLAKLQGIVTRLESEDLPLESSVSLFKEGVALAKSCRKQLESAKNEVTLVSKGLLEPFELDSETAARNRSDENDDEVLPF